MVGFLLATLLAPPDLKLPLPPDPTQLSGDELALFDAEAVLAWCREQPARVSAVVRTEVECLRRLGRRDEAAAVLNAAWPGGSFGRGDVPAGVSSALLEAALSLSANADNARFAELARVLFGRHGPTPDNVAAMAIAEAIEGDTDAARRRIEEALKLHPRDVRVLNAARFIASRGSDVGAVADFQRRVLEVSPLPAPPESGPDQYLRWALLCEQAGRTEEGLRAVALSTALYGFDGDRTKVAARLGAAGGLPEFGRLAAYFRKVEADAKAAGEEGRRNFKLSPRDFALEEVAPKHRPALFPLRESLGMLTGVCGTDDPDRRARAAVRIAMLSLRHDAAAGAEPVLAKVRNASPDDEDAFNAWAGVVIAGGDDGPKGDQRFRPGHRPVLLAEAVRAKPDFGRVEAVARRGRLEYPEEPAFVERLTQAVAEQGRFGEALEYADAASALDPTTAVTVVRTAALLKAGRHEEALSSALLAAGLRPNAPPNLQNLSATAEHAGRMQLAWAASRRFLGLYPRQYASFKNAFAVSLKLRRYGEARELIADHRDVLTVKQRTDAEAEVAKAEAADPMRVPIVP